MAIGTTVKVGWDATKVNRGVRSLKTSVGGLGNVFKQVAKGALGITAAFTGATLIYARKFAREMDRIGKLSTRFGESAESMQRIAEAAKLGGTDLEVVAKGMQAFVRNLIDAENGTGEYADAVKLFGFNASEIINLPLEEKLLAVAAAMERMKDSPRALAALQDLMSRGGPEMAAMVKQGPAALAKQLGEATVVSERTVRAMELVNDTITKMGLKVRGVFAESIAGIIPIIEAKMPELEAKFKEWADLAGTAISDAFAGDSELLKAIFVVLGDEAGKAFVAAFKKVAKTTLWDTGKSWGEGMEQRLYDWDAQRQIKANPGKTTFTGLYGGKINVADYQATKGIGRSGGVDPEVREALDVIAQATAAAAEAARRAAEETRKANEAKADGWVTSAGTPYYGLAAP